MSDIREDQVDLITGKTQAEMREERTHELSEIQKTYGDNLPYDRKRVVNEAKFFINQTAQSMLEVGKRLILIKEHETVESFIEIVEMDFKIGKSTAYNLMQAAAKFLTIDSKSFQALGNLGLTKLLDLANQEDEVLEALADGGTVAGLTLDEMDKMTTRELKRALKEAKADQDAVRKVSADKDKKINELSEKLEKSEAKSKKEIEKLKLDESETDRLMKSYKLTLAEVTGDILASNSKLQQLFAKATADALPKSFFQDFARELLSVRQNLELVAEQLPSDDGIVDSTWMDEA
ncbi:DUF3102 domain-containing protein [Ignatzschineria rhizosphaerae]|uniref:DUF3102 domain-containing protein n=1 Tax=Ignatzschineria rhizosphaerae TaxID=2923279 RepID=A0ABY3X1P6_9GAMM|nr:DUF3102 domain-containing protein [Ignatzschineria rhizosphaerae]UNM95691.1 DUF3102 domain-containing protein [Ignatzschineria rhizosphaerae]